MSEVEVDFFLQQLPHPNVVGQSEYRAVYEVLSDAVYGLDEDEWIASGRNPEVVRRFMYDVLEEVKSSADLLAAQIRQVRLPRGRKPAPVERRTYMIVMGNGDRKVYQATDAMDASNQHQHKHPKDRPTDIQLVRS